MFRFRAGILASIHDRVTGQVLGAEPLPQAKQPWQFGLREAEFTKSLAPGKLI